MNILKINNGKVDIRKDTGSLLRTIGNGDAVFADFNSAQTLVLITTTKGLVEIRSDYGSLVRTIGSGNASSARWNGDDVAITTNNGKVEIRKASVSLVRTISFNIPIPNVKYMVCSQKYVQYYRARE